VCGEVELDQLLVEREKINAHLQSIIDEHTEPWGIKVVQVAIKFIDLPEEMRRVMAHQAEAERERRAKVIAAEGEYQAAQRLADAAAIMAKEPIALQLRFLQTLVEVASENNSTTIFPVPIDILNVPVDERGPLGVNCPSASSGPRRVAAGRFPRPWPPCPLPPRRSARRLPRPWPPHRGSPRGSPPSRRPTAW
jgi:SPFH domain / Band 7 family